MMKPLGLEYQKIYMCLNFCILYYGEDVNLTECKTYRYDRYKPNMGKGKTLVAYKKLRSFPIIHKLQKLFMPSKTAKHIT